MPFKSKAQAGFMFANHPEVAKEFASKTPSIKALPNKVGGDKVPAQPQSGYRKNKTMRSDY